MNVISFTRLENESFWQIIKLIISVNKFETLFILIFIVSRYWKKASAQDIGFKWKVDFNIYKIQIFKIPFSIFITITGLWQGKHRGQTCLWHLPLGNLQGLWLSVEHLSWPRSHDGKYKRSCQETRVFDSPKEGHSRKKTQGIMLPSYCSSLS